MPFWSKKKSKTDAKKATIKVATSAKKGNTKKKPADALSNEDNLHQHLHYRFRFLNHDPLLVKSKSKLTKKVFLEKHNDQLSNQVLDGVLASENLEKKGIDEAKFVNIFGDFFLPTVKFNDPKEKEKAEKKIVMLTFDVITRTTKTKVVTADSLTKFLDICTPLPDDQRRTRTRQLRTWFAENVDGGLSGKLTKVDFYKKITQFAEEEDAYIDMFDPIKKDIPSFPETAHAEKYFQGIEPENEEEATKTTTSQEKGGDNDSDANNNNNNGKKKKSIFPHWTTHHDHHKCKFPFQVFAIETYKGNHGKTEISLKKGDLIKVSGECNADGTQATDVPRTKKKVNGIMDVNYPVYDPNSNKYWIGELIKYTADPKHYPNHTIGHFPIKAVQPSDIYLDQQAKASAKRVEDRKEERKKEEGNNTARSNRTESTEDDEYEITFQKGPIGLKLFDKNDACCVLAIQPGSQAEKAEDIAKGDIVVQINDTDVDGEPTAKIMKMLKELPRPVRITFLMGDDEED